MISLRQLHYFVEIVESGGFSRAAERLFVAQSALSRQVRELEDSIGTPLLRRGPRQVELTPAGRAFLPRAQRLLGDLRPPGAWLARSAKAATACCAWGTPARCRWWAACKRRCAATSRRRAASAWN